MATPKFQVGDKVKCSSRCPNSVLFKGINKVREVYYSHNDKCCWYTLGKEKRRDYRSYELEKI